jgi:hypothetical protein
MATTVKVNLFLAEKHEAWAITCITGLFVYRTFTVTPTVFTWRRSINPGDWSRSFESQESEYVESLSGLVTVVNREASVKYTYRFDEGQAGKQLDFGDYYYEVIPGVGVQPTDPPAGG